MIKRTFSKEQEAWIREQLSLYASYEVLEMIQKEINPEYTAKQFRSWRVNRHLKGAVRKTCLAGTSKLFSIEIMNYIKENYMTMESPYMADQINKIFGTSYTKEQIRYYRHNHKLFSNLSGGFNETRPNPHKGDHNYVIPNSNSSRFKINHKPANYLALNTIQHKSDGYLYIKIAEPDVWQQYSRYVWEKNTGTKLSEDQKLKFLDGNSDNCDISNLMLMTNTEHMICINKNRYTTNPELTKAGVLVTRLENTLKEKTDVTCNTK